MVDVDRREPLVVALALTGLAACSADVGDSTTTLRAVDEDAMIGQLLYMQPDVTPYPMTAAELEASGTDATACGSGGNESRLVISADTMRFYESSGPVQSASVDGNELTVVVRLTGEGETREAIYRFRLSADGRTLTDADSALARQRCE